MAADPVTAWCGRDERQTRHHLFVNCEAWRPQIQELWKGGNAAGGNTREPPDWPCSSATRERQKRFCPSFARQRWGRWPLPRLRAERKRRKEEEEEGGRGKGNPGGTKAKVEGEEGGAGYS